MTPSSKNKTEKKNSQSKSMISRKVIQKETRINRINRLTQQRSHKIRESANSRSRDRIAILLVPFHRSVVQYFPFTLHGPPVSRTRSNGLDQPSLFTLKDLDIDLNDANLSIIVPNERNIHHILTFGLIADVIIGVFNGCPDIPYTHENSCFDEVGYDILRGLKMQGMPLVIPLVVGQSSNFTKDTTRMCIDSDLRNAKDVAHNQLNARKRGSKTDKANRNNIRMIFRYFVSEFPQEKTKDVVLYTELRDCFHAINTIRLKPIIWRQESQRGYMLAESVEIDKNSLILHGFMSGAGFRDTARVLYVSGIGMFTVKAIGQKGGALDVLHSTNESPLRDPGEGVSDDIHDQSLSDIMEEDYTPSTGASDSGDDNFEDHETFRPRYIDEDSRCNFFVPSRKTEDLEFDDEVDVPVPPGSGRRRFQKYRGLQSLRTSQWHCHEDLPVEYNRIWTWQDWQASRQSTITTDCKKNTRGCISVVLEPISTHNHLIPDCNVPLSDDLNPTEGDAQGTEEYNIILDTFRNTQKLLGGIVVSTLFEDEDKYTILESSLTSCSGEKVKSKTKLFIRMGFKVFVERPIFSEEHKRRNRNECHKNHEDGPKLKFLRTSPNDKPFSMFHYACNYFGPSPVMIFRLNSFDGKTQDSKILKDPSDMNQLNHSNQSMPLEGSAKGVHFEHNPLAYGSLRQSSPNVIVAKRITLTGYVIRSHDTKCIVRYMFFDPKDISWFKKIELTTKSGLRGHITSALGTKGHMKVVFNGHLKQNETVCMNLYKRQFPKWVVCKKDVNDMNSSEYTSRL